MPLLNDLETLEGEISRNAGYRDVNKTLIDIYEGDLKTHLEIHLREIFSPQVYTELLKLLVPINVLQRIVDKLSKIYQEKVSRNVIDGNDQDSELLVWYEDNFRVNQMMNIANEFFNLTKATLVEVFLHEGKPRLRVIPNDRFFVYSDDIVDPTNPTHITLIMGDYLKGAKKVKTYATWTDTEALIWDSDNTVRFDLMEKIWGGLPQAEGVNPFGKMPFVYVENSHNLLIPKHDTDVLDLTLEIPAQISFLNYAIAYNAFSITYGIDIDDEGLNRAPNAFWSIKSDPTSDKKPEIGTIKPQVDISETIKFIETELAFWLNTKGIKPGSMGTLTTENAASGISKMVDEMDTVEARKKQIEFFENGEMELWDLVLNHMHPFWVNNSLIENRSSFSPVAEVVTTFTEPMPLQTRADIVSALKGELDAGFTSRSRVIKKLNPDLSEIEIDELIAEIDNERTIELPETKEIQEETEETEEVTSTNQGHSHFYELDANGNGETSIANGHSHTIVNMVVQEADGHTHRIN